MPYEVKPLACNPTAVNGMSERLIVSHYENNYGGRFSGSTQSQKSWPNSILPARRSL